MDRILMCVMCSTLLNGWVQSASATEPHQNQRCQHLYEHLQAVIAEGEQQVERSREIDGVIRLKSEIELSLLAIAALDPTLREIVAAFDRSFEEAVARLMREQRRDISAWFDARALAHEQWTNACRPEEF